MSRRTFFPPSACPNPCRECAGRRGGLAEEGNRRGSRFDSPVFEPRMACRRGNGKGPEETLKLTTDCGLRGKRPQYQRFSLAGTAAGSERETGQPSSSAGG